MTPAEIQRWAVAALGEAAVLTTQTQGMEIDLALHISRVAQFCVFFDQLGRWHQRFTTNDLVNERGEILSFQVHVDCRPTPPPIANLRVTEIKTALQFLLDTHAPLTISTQPAEGVMTWRPQHLRELSALVNFLGSVQVTYQLLARANRWVQLRVDLNDFPR
ncbi:hypothetical protein [Levilactobacillus zymae]|uniref:hypothetical protein n=1 Tax=Levilactobacillus zymae TaxID=267363 RepID=UPI0028BA9C4E|nr:hypothetical protein [Levilactobacillus zymae]MDT6979432.1 hypothetical protein [Levilactobacillus zymae]